MLANKLFAAQVPSVSAAAELFSLVGVTYDNLSTLHSAPLSSFNIYYPPGISAGDLALLFWSDDFGAVRAAGASGFSPISSDTAGVASTITGACYYRLCTGTESGNLITISATIAAFYAPGAILLVFSPSIGHSFGSVTSTTILQNSTINYIATCPSIDGLTSTNNYLDVRFAGLDDPSENSAVSQAAAPTGYTIAGNKIAKSATIPSSVNIAASYYSTARTGITSTGLSEIAFNQAPDISVGMSVAISII